MRSELNAAADLMSRFPARQPSANQNAARLRNNQRRHRARVKAQRAELEAQLTEMTARLEDALKKIAHLSSEVEALRRGHVTEPQASTDSDSTVRVARARSRLPAMVPSPSNSEIRLLRPFSESIIPDMPGPCIGERAVVGESDASVASQTVHAPTRGMAVHPPGVPGSPIGGEIPRPRCSSDCNQDQKHEDGETQGSQPDVLLVMMSGEDCDCLPALQSGESTIPCATAYKVIEQQNISGLDVADITKWLQPGFRKAPGKGIGCRVDTQLLFALLDYISSSNGL